jgi:hypothetical protein
MSEILNPSTVTGALAYAVVFLAAATLGAGLSEFQWTGCSHTPTTCRSTGREFSSGVSVRRTPYFQS